MIHSFFTQYSQVVGALANPRRLEIIHLLRDHELTVSALYQMLDFPQANISQHLQVLRKHHVVVTRRSGKHKYYRLRDNNIVKACDLLHQFVKNQNGYFKDTNIDITKLTPLAHDPICGMQVAPKLSDFTATHHHETYFFCASGCLKTFQANPDKYAKAN